MSILKRVHEFFADETDEPAVVHEEPTIEAASVSSGPAEVAVCDEPGPPPVQVEPKPAPKKKKRRRKDRFGDVTIERLVEIGDFGHTTMKYGPTRFSCTSEALYSWLQRMVSKQLLVRHPFVANEYFWMLHGRAPKLLSEEYGIKIPQRAATLSTTQFARFHALLMFCTTAEPQLKRCRPCLMAEHFPKLHKEFVSLDSAKSKRHRYTDPLHSFLFYEGEQPGIVGLFQLDNGRDNFVTRFEKRVSENVFHEYPGFVAKAKRDEFALTIAASTKSRCDEIRKQLGELDVPLPYDVICRPEMGPVQVFVNKTKSRNGGKRK